MTIVYARRRAAGNGARGNIDPTGRAITIDATQR